MALSGKYGKIDIPKIGSGEPVFILRAQDRLAVATLEMYRALVRTHNVPMAEDLQKEIDAFNKWTGSRKTPD